MPTLYIHAGMPKTGTTAVQCFLYDNRTLLIEQTNLYYPETGIVRQQGKSHYGLFPINNAAWKQLSVEISAHCTSDIVISDERMYFNTFQKYLPAHLDIVRETFPGYDLKIVLYIRRVDDWIKSTFNQMMKRNLAFRGVSYPDFIKKIGNTALISKQIASACEMVGKDNLLFGLYNPDTLKNNDIVEDFFLLLGREVPKNAHRSSIVNPSLPPAAIPLVAESFLPLSLQDPLRKKIIELLKASYSYPSGNGAGDEYLPEFEEEIDKIETYVPGYRKLFAKRPLSFSFPEMDIKDPQLLFIISLLYLLLIEQRNGTFSIQQNDYKKQFEDILASKSWRYTAPLRDVKKKIKQLFNQDRA